MTPGRCLLLLGMLASALVAAAADPSTLCRNGRGKVAAREACRTRETPLALEDLGAGGLPGPAGPKGPAGVAGVHLIDPNGRDVGRAVTIYTFGSPNRVIVLAVFTHPSLAGPVLLQVTGDGLLGGLVQYESTDCSGTPYVEAPPLWLPLVTGIGDTVYVTDQRAQGTITPRSSEIDPRPIYTCDSITPRGGCCRVQSSNSRQAYTVTTTTPAALGLHTPFTARTVP